MNRFTLVTLTGALTLALIGPAAAEQPAASAIPSAHADAIQPGMKVYRDPATGQLTSTPPSAAAAAALDTGAFRTDLSKIQEIHKADGSIEWVFNGQVDSALVARRGADGKLQIVCAEHGVVDQHQVTLGGEKRDER